MPSSSPTVARARMVAAASVAGWAGACGSLLALILAMLAQFGVVDIAFLAELPVFVCVCVFWVGTGLLSGGYMFARRDASFVQKKGSWLRGGTNLWSFTPMTRTRHAACSAVYVLVFLLVQLVAASAHAFALGPSAPTVTIWDGWLTWLALSTSTGVTAGVSVHSLIRKLGWYRSEQARAAVVRENPQAQHATASGLPGGVSFWRWFTWRWRWDCWIAAFGYLLLAIAIPLRVATDAQQTAAWGFLASAVVLLGAAALGSNSWRGLRAPWWGESLA